MLDIRSSVFATFRKRLYSMDVYVLSMLALYSLCTLMYWQSIENRWTLIIMNLLFATVVISLVSVQRENSPTWIVAMRKFYAIPMIYPIYLETASLLFHVRERLYDTELIALDKAIFGVNPTEWIYQFSNPYLTEYLQLCYVAFFFLPCFHGFELFMRKQYPQVLEFARTIVFSFFISYLGYFAFPAIGPRFTLHDYATLDKELPGVLFTSYLRDKVSAGAGITNNTDKPDQVVNRDCMPSGHTMMTIINIVFAWRYRSKLRWFFSIVGGSLIISTVYLRYHYTIDIVVGMLLAALMFFIEPLVHRYLVRRKLSYL